MIYEFVGPTAAPFDRTPSLRAFPARRHRPGPSAPYLTSKSQKGPWSPPSVGNPEILLPVYDGRNLSTCFPSVFPYCE